MDFSSICEHFTAKNQGFCFFRHPNEGQINFVAGHHQIDSNDAFLFFPFTEENHPWIQLKKELKIEGASFNELLNTLSKKIPVQAYKAETIKTTSEESTTFKAYENAFGQIKDAIRQKTVSKVILSKREVHAFEAHETVKLFNELLNNNKTAFCFLFFHPSAGCWIGASPELILKSNLYGYTTTALAGTKNKESDPWGEKENDEHKIVTSFIYNKLSDITSNITIGEKSTVKAGNVFHLKQDISFQIKDSELLPTLFKLHPTPAIGGLPREEALSLIKQIEVHERSYYCGFLGESSKNENRIYVNLRSAQITANQIIIYAGGGITNGSDLISEWKECERKASNISQYLIPKK